MVTKGGLGCIFSHRGLDTDTHSLMVSSSRLIRIFIKFIFSIWYTRINQNNHNLWLNKIGESHPVSRLLEEGLAAPKCALDVSGPVTLRGVAGSCKGRGRDQHIRYSTGSPCAEPALTSQTHNGLHSGYRYERKCYGHRAVRHMR